FPLDQWRRRLATDARRRRDRTGAGRGRGWDPLCRAVGRWRGPLSTRGWAVAVGEWHTQRPYTALGVAGAPPATGGARRCWIVGLLGGWRAHLAAPAAAGCATLSLGGYRATHRRADPSLRCG